MKDRLPFRSALRPIRSLRAAAFAFQVVSIGLSLVQPLLIGRLLDEINAAASGAPFDPVAGTSLLLAGIALRVAAIAVILIRLNPVLTLTAAGIFLVYLSLYLLLNRGLRPRMRAERERFSEVMGGAQETLEGFSTIKTDGQEAYSRGGFRARSTGGRICSYSTSRPPRSTRKRRRALSARWTPASGRARAYSSPLRTARRCLKSAIRSFGSRAGEALSCFRSKRKLKFAPCAFLHSSSAWLASPAHEGLSWSRSIFNERALRADRPASPARDASRPPA